EELERWLRSYRPEELFDDDGALIAELAELAPAGARRMGANPHANGGAVMRDLRMPEFRRYAVDVPRPGATTAEATRVVGSLLRDVMRLNLGQRNFRLFGADENASNRLDAVYDVTGKTWLAEATPEDEHLAADVVRVYLPPAANTLLVVADRCLRSRNLVNVVVAGKQPAPQYLDMEAAIRHVSKGAGIWDWASNDQGGEPDVVMACAGDVPTM